MIVQAGFIPGIFTIATLPGADQCPFACAWVSDYNPGSGAQAGIYYSSGSAWFPLQGGSFVVGAPTSRTLTAATAYQATTPARAALVTVNLTSTANFSLSGGTTNSANIVIGATNAVASGTGTQIALYSNSSTGTIAIGLNQNTVQANPQTFVLPANWYWAVRVSSGAVTITSAFDQAVG